MGLISFVILSAQSSGSLLFGMIPSAYFAYIASRSRISDFTPHIFRFVSGIKDQYYAGQRRQFPQRSTEKTS